MLPRRGPGPVVRRCREAAARVPVRLAGAAHLAGFGLEDLGTLRGLQLKELALLADYLHIVPRITARWALDFADRQGVTDHLRGARGMTPEAFLARVGAAKGWALDEPGPRAAALALLEHLAEVQLLAYYKGAYTWRGPDVVRDLNLAPDEEVRARELYAGPLAFYRACLDALPEALRGKQGPIGFGPEHAPLWDGVLGSPPNLLLRRLGLKAAKAPPGDVLDLACGVGHSTACIVEEWPGSSIVAIDITEVNYPLVEERARESAAALGLPLELEMARHWPGWGEELPFPDASFDAVFFPMNDGFVPPHRRAEVYAEMRRVLRPGGQVVVVSAPRPDPTWRPRTWELRAQTLFHHAVEFAVMGFHGLVSHAEQLAALQAAGFPTEPSPRRLGGLVWVLQAPPAP